MSVPSLPPAGVVRAVVDTDTYNEIDDQFAVVYGLSRPGARIRAEALYAAPFHNKRSTGPADGMLQSYDELHRLLDRLPPHRAAPYIMVRVAGFRHRTSARRYRVRTAVRQTRTRRGQDRGTVDDVEIVTRTMTAIARAASSPVAAA